MTMEEADRSPAGGPILDSETHALAQELFQLVRAGKTPRLARLLEMGLVPNLCDGKSDSPLMLASYHDHREMTRLLLAHGCAPELANDRGRTPLTGAARPRWRITSCSRRSATSTASAFPSGWCQATAAEVLDGMLDRESIKMRKKG
jgi:hypothetical protein